MKKQTKKGTFFDTVKNGCTAFSVITLLLYSIGALISSGTEKQFVPNVKFIWLFFIFSLLLAFANKILFMQKLSVAVRMIIHFAASFALYFITVVVCGGYIKNGKTAFISIIIFIVLYVIFGIATAVILSKKEAKKQENKKYEKQF